MYDRLRHTGDFNACNMSLPFPPPLTGHRLGVKGFYGVLWTRKVLQELSNVVGTAHIVAVPHQGGCIHVKLANHLERKKKSSIEIEINEFLFENNYILIIGHLWHCMAFKTRGLSAYTARSSFKLFSIATNACMWMLAKQGERRIKR